MKKKKKKQKVETQTLDFKAAEQTVKHWELNSVRIISSFMKIY